MKGRLVNRRTPRRVLLALAAVVGLSLAPGLPEGAFPASAAFQEGSGTDDVTAGPGDPILPDLRTLPPFGIRIRWIGPTRFLRFANTVWNSGAAPLELHGATDRTTQRTFVTQLAPDAAGGAPHQWPVGQFTFHPTHAHWHLEDFAEYELWTIDESGRLDVLLVRSDKVSYCLIDTDIVRRFDPSRPAGRQYVGCGRAVQGLSVGWGDKYAAHLDGQSLPLDGVGDGLYALVSTANPGGRLRESNRANNTAIVYLAITGDEVRIVEDRLVAKEGCLARGGC